MTHRTIFNTAAALLLAWGLPCGASLAQFTITPDADTYITNGDGSGPGVIHGNENFVQVRLYDDGTQTRVRIGYVRFDITGVSPSLYANATISGTFSASAYNGPGQWDVWGLNDNVVANGGIQGNDWDEATLNYSTAGGLDNLAPIGSYGFTTDATELGIITLDGIDEQPLPFSSNVTDLPLGSFLSGDTDGLVTFMFVSSEVDGLEYRVNGKEQTLTGGHIPMTLTFFPDPGDVDGINGVDLTDLQIIADHFRQEVAGRLFGDLTNDGVVDFDDFDEWKRNYTGSLSSLNLDFLTAKIPEPSSALLALLGMGGLIACRRRKQDIH